MMLNQEEKDLTTITQHIAGFLKTPDTGLDQGQLLLPGWTKGSLFQAPSCQQKQPGSTA